MPAEGFYLVQGDKTTCGGKITTGAEDHTLFDKPVAREQDSVTCGKHAGLFRIAGGIDNDTIHDRRMAGTLDSYSTCPCKAKFIPSMMDDTYEKIGGGGARSDVLSDQKDITETASLTDNPAVIQNSLTGMCFAEQNELTEGVFLWTETQGAGHAFVSIHIENAIYVFTYGRYDQEGFSPVGEGVLIKYSGERAERFYTKELYRMGASVFKILDVDESSTLSIFNSLWASSDIRPDGKHTSPDIKEDGRVIDSYNLAVNNCTTTSVTGLKMADTGIFDVKLLDTFGYSEDFSIPSSLNAYLEDLASNPTDMRVMKMTDEFIDKYHNASDYNKIDGAGSGNETAGTIGKGSGIVGKGSSGYAPTTFSRSQGDLND
ncbi:PAAR domain-containing protein [Scandinavium lactucae]|uniref:PAAR domain-containing protein n=1 Tax=Scandinavium lactucae TaxID=3095028 RepID=A0ABU4QPR6_9ENTR|nr:MULTISPECIES: PAAR domain-containing protein [unclassified Scandinavium]MDX6041233.1 PAAR domain-containing protein [Scandinavium sp. V105_6]MDX6049751.1 PAAR domain-containing protein [Scandinavium sp. V105_1]